MKPSIFARPFARKPGPTITSKNCNQLLQSGVRDWRGAVQLSFALSKELEDLERFDESFKYLASGAKLRRQNLKYDPSNDLAIFPALQEAFSKSGIDKRKESNSGEQSDAPIFVLGLPRSGSTFS